MPSKLNDAIGSAAFGSKDYESGLQLYKQMVDGQEKYALASANKIAEVQRRLYNTTENLSNHAKKRSLDIAIKYEEELNKQRSVLERKSAEEEKKRAIENYELKLKQDEAYELAKIKSSTATEKQKAEREKKLREKTAKEERAIAVEKEKNAKVLEKYDKIAYDRLSTKDKIQKNISKLQEKVAEKQKETDAAKMKLLEAQEKGDEEAIAVAKSEYNAAKTAERKAGRKAAWSQFGANMLSSLANAVSKVGDSMNSAVEESLNFILQNRSRVSTRLLGSGMTYESLTGTISRNLAASPYVSQKSVVENLAKLVDSGIAYNVEQRAFLATISDKIATTFDAFDSNLTRLIRLQQADITTARLGIEATLTNQLNKMFSDTSYLNDMYKTVSAALVDAESQMTREQAAEFEYTVQKYLGSLYSLGLSQSAVSTIATGIGYLGTGNIEALSSNSALMNLFGMGAATAGRDIGSVITGGATAEDANKILKGVVQYLRTIAKSGGNMAVKSAYGSMFGMSLSDLRALANLTDADIAGLYGSSLSYSGAVDTTKSLLGSMYQRLTVSDMMQNVLDNLMFSTGRTLSQTPGLYMPYKIAGEVKKLTGGTDIPMIAGFKVGNTVEGLLQTALVGIGLFGGISDAISSLSNKGGLSLEGWNAKDFTTRGKDWTGITGGYDTGVSMATYIAGAGGDIKDAVLKRANDEAKQQAGETDTIDITTLYNALFGTNGADRKPLLVEINGVSAGVAIPTKITETENNPIFVKESI